MNYLDFHNKLKSLESEDYIECLLIYNLSTVIAGVKPASTITFNKIGTNLYDKWITYGIDFIKEINLGYVELKESEKFVVVMIYDKDSLNEVLFNKANKRFLIKIGYDEEDSLEKYLNKLKRRYKMYNCPHELGVFLGIPIEDVKGFMDCKDKQCLLCGYWMVYSNYNSARMVFDLYDKIREDTIKGIIDGCKYKDLILNIKHAQYC